MRHKGKEYGGKSQARKSAWICWPCDLPGTAGLCACLSPPFLGPSSLALWRRCQAGAPLAAGCHLGWGQGASPGPRPDPAGFRGSSRSLRRPGAGAKGCRGVLPAVPSAGVAALPCIPFCTRSILAPIDGRFPAGEGRCCPAGQEKWLFAEPGAGSSIDLWCLVRDQLGRSLAVPGAQRGPGLGGERGNARLAEGARGHGMLWSRPAHTSHPAHPPEPSLPQFPGSELG